MTKYDYIAHLSDIHIRDDDIRENEYLHVFNNVCKLIEKISIKNLLIIITGDILHNKNRLSPSVLYLVNNFLNGLSKLGDVRLIAGNHDVIPGMVNERSLWDVIHLPDNVVYIRNTGEYVLKNITLGVSCLVDNKFIKYDEIKNIINQLVIGVGHYTLKEWSDERGICTKDSDRVRSVEDFKGYKYVCLGDIHCSKVYKNCRYSGSLIQQNFSETGKRSFGLLNIKKDKWEKIIVNSEYAFQNIYVNNVNTFIENIDFTKFSYIKLHLTTDQVNMVDVYTKKLSQQTQIQKIRYNIVKEDELINNCEKLQIPTLTEDEILKSLIPPNVNSQTILDIHNRFKSDDGTGLQNKCKWYIKNLKFENILKYRGEHIINFENIKGIIGVSGLNASGKSSLIKILIFALCGEISLDFSLVDRDYTKISQSYNHYKFDTTNLINYDIPKVKKGYTEIELIHENHIYFIHRSIEKRNTNVSTTTSVSIDDRTNILMSSLPKNAKHRSEKDINKFIYKMIGRSTDLFLLNVINKHSSSFTDISEISRFNIFSNIFHLNHYSTISIKVRESIKQIKENILKNKGKKEYILVPSLDLDINIKTYKTKIESLEQEKKFLTSMITNGLKNMDLITNIPDLEQSYNSAIKVKSKYASMYFPMVGNGDIEKPPDNLSFNSILKTYNNLPEISINMLNKLNKELIDYDYDIDQIIEQENEYMNILSSLNETKTIILPKVKRINDISTVNFNIDYKIGPIETKEKILKTIDIKDINSKLLALIIPPLKVIRKKVDIIDNEDNLKICLDSIYDELHQITNIDDIIKTLKMGKINQSQIVRLEKIAKIDDIILNFSQKLTDTHQRISKLQNNKVYNKEIDDDIEYNKNVINNQKEHTRLEIIKKDYLIYTIRPYIIEINRRLTYIEKYKHFDLSKGLHLKKIEFEKYIRYYNKEAEININKMNQILLSVNHIVKTQIDIIYKDISTLENKIESKQHITTINKSLEDMIEECKSLEIYNKLIAEDIKTVILTKYLDQISDLINNIIENLVDFKIQLLTVSNISEKGNRVKLNIIRDDITGCFSLSAFEDFVLTLTSKVVLNIYNNNSTATFLILDECLECIDTENKSKIEELFKKLSENYKHIILITHIESYYDRCDNYIKINNGNIKII